MSVLILPSVSSIAFAQYMPPQEATGLDDYLKLSEDRVRLANENPHTSSGTLHLISVDGTYREVLLPYTNNNPGDFAVSPDGDYIIYGVGNDFEIMTLAQQIPEFQTITMMILAASIIPIILARNKLILR